MNLLAHGRPFGFAFAFYIWNSRLCNCGVVWHADTLHLWWTLVCRHWALCNIRVAGVAEYPSCHNYATYRPRAVMLQSFARISCQVNAMAKEMPLAKPIAKSLFDNLT